MTCDTIVRINPDGSKVYKRKKAYNTLDDAIKQAKRMNSEVHMIHKLVSYKCSYCHKYHVGRSKKILTEKQRLKYQKEIYGNLKVVGKIDLEKFIQ